MDAIISPHPTGYQIRSLLYGLGIMKVKKYGYSVLRTRSYLCSGAGKFGEHFSHWNSNFPLPPSAKHDDRPARTFGEAGEQRAG